MSAWLIAIDICTILRKNATKCKKMRKIFANVKSFLYICMFFGGIECNR